MKAKTDTAPPENSAAVSGSDHHLVRPFERVEFENGLEVMLQDDGSLRVLASGRGVRGISISPRSDASCSIHPVGTLIRPNVTAQTPPDFGTKDHE